MNQTGHIKDTEEDENGYRQFVVNCIGANDLRKYFSISPFGYDFNAPQSVRTLTADSRNKDQSFTVGVLNKIRPDDLNPGECAIFSLDETGGEVKSFIKLRNDGTMEQNGSDDFLAGFNNLKSGFDALKSDFNNLVNAYNAHTHITTATVAATPTPGVIAPTTSTGTPSTASIDSAKKENLKTE